MPKCGCFHEYNLEQVGVDEYNLALRIDGPLNLEDILQNARLVKVVSVHLGRLVLSLRKQFTLSGVTDEASLRKFLDLLSSRVIIDLKPRVDECYSLAPYTVFDEWNQGAKHLVGELLNQAKYVRGKQGNDASLVLGGNLDAFIAAHPRLRSARHIVAVPKGDPVTPDLAGQWAQVIAAKRHLQLLEATKVRQTDPQKNMPDSATEEVVVARVANSVEAKIISQGSGVVIVDDTIRSGGTMLEVARALREAGAEEVFGVSVAKDAKFTQGGIDLHRERWQ